MEIEDLFEDWDDVDLEGLESYLTEENGVDELDEEEVIEEIDGSESSSDCEDDDHVSFKCCKCKKVYHTRGWLKKHEDSCSGASETTKKKPITPKMSAHQKKTRAVLTDLGFEKYFSLDCLPVILKHLREITSISSDIAKVRGSRFASCQSQAHILVAELEKGKETLTERLFRFVAKEIWTIAFARDHLVSSSTRQQYVAQHLNEFRQADELSSKWAELCTVARFHSSDSLLLQLVVSVIFGDICRYRTESVKAAMNIREDYGETPNEPSLTPVEKDIIAYIAGYVCRKTRDRLRRYCNARSSKQASKEKCERLQHALSQMIPGVGKQMPDMTFPNLMTLSLTRGGLSQVDHATFNFFCYLEVSIRPFLNLASFRNSTRKSDCELLDQLITNSSLLQPTWPYSSSLPAEESNMLLKLFVDLYFRVRKWAYLKAYKEERNVKERRLLVKTSPTSNNLHGKDSIRKVLLSAI